MKKILRYIILSILTISFVTTTLRITTAESTNSQTDINNTFNIFRYNGTTLLSSSSTEQPLRSVCISDDFNVNGATIIGGPGIDFMFFNTQAPIGKDTVFPTTTIDLVYEINDNPLNGIPQLPDNVFERFGEDIEVTENPDNDNQVIVSLPALTVEESQDILCDVFDLFAPPNLLISQTKRFGRTRTSVFIDIDIIKFDNTPFLQTHNIKILQDNLATVSEQNLSETQQQPTGSPIPTDLEVRLKDWGLFLTKIEAAVTVKDQFGNIMPNVEVAAFAESDSKRKGAEVNPASAITDSNGNAMFTFSLPFIGATITFKTDGLSSTFTMGLIGVFPKN
ncbi:MAG: Ig-like domain-containing protein [Candidatus Anammoxibacter sp.]